MLLLLAACGGSPTCWTSEDVVTDDEALSDHDATLGALVASVSGVRTVSAIDADGRIVLAEVEVERSPGDAVFADGTLTEATPSPLPAHPPFGLTTNLTAKCEDVLTVPVRGRLRTADDAYDFAGTGEAIVQGDGPWDAVDIEVAADGRVNEENGDPSTLLLRFAAGVLVLVELADEDGSRVYAPTGPP